MKFTRRTKVLKGPPDTLPFVNVMLLLLLFFIIGAHFVQQPGVPVQLPAATVSAGSPAAGRHPLIITVTAEDPHTRTSRIFFNDELVTFSQLGPLLMDAAHLGPRRDCVIRADERASHGSVVSILGLAQQAGFRTVRLATRPPQTEVPPKKP